MTEKKRKKTGGDTGWNVVHTITLEEHRRLAEVEAPHFVRYQERTGGDE